MCTSSRQFGRNMPVAVVPSQYIMFREREKVQPLLHSRAMLASQVIERKCKSSLISKPDLSHPVRIEKKLKVYAFVTCKAFCIDNL